MSKIVAMLFADLTLARRLEGAKAQLTLQYAPAQAYLRSEVGATVEAVAGGRWFSPEPVPFWFGLWDGAKRTAFCLAYTAAAMVRGQV